MGECVRLKLREKAVRLPGVALKDEGFDHWPSMETHHVKRPGEEAHRTAGSNLYQQWRCFWKLGLGVYPASKTLHILHWSACVQFPAVALALGFPGMQTWGSESLPSTWENLGFWAPVFSLTQFIVSARFIVGIWEVNPQDGGYVSVSVFVSLSFKQTEQFLMTLAK